MKKIRRIMVTGGAGFIASHIVDSYIEYGYEVLVIDDLSSGQLKNINQKAKFEKIDITNLNQVNRIVNQFKPDIINHHAAHILVGNSVKYPQFDAMVNIIGLLNILESSKSFLKKVIMASTGGAIYGDKQTPFIETMLEQPLSPYGISKRAGELYLHYYYSQYQIPYLVLRYANVYGPRQNAVGESGVIAIFSDAVSNGKQPIINGDGTHTRDYVFVDDIVKANLLALNSQYCGCLNIGTATEISTNYVFDKIVKEFGKKVKKVYGPERPGEQVASSLSYVKAKKILNWEPKMKFNRGIRKTLDWYKKNEN